jgi:hypothetical protein
VREITHAMPESGNQLQRPGGARSRLSVLFSYDCNIIGDLSSSAKMIGTEPADVRV